MAKCKLDNLEEVKQAIATAKQYVDGKPYPLTVDRLAACLGVEPHTLADYKNERHSDENMLDEEHQEICSIIKNAYLECGAQVLEHGLTPGVNPAMAIFYEKNRHGMVNKHELSTSSTVTFTDSDLPD